MSLQQLITVCNTGYNVFQNNGCFTTTMNNLLSSKLGEEVVVLFPALSSACNLSLRLHTAPTTSNNKVEEHIFSLRGKTRGK